jgi:hypothetical protein
MHAAKTQRARFFVLCVAVVGFFFFAAGFFMVDDAVDGEAGPGFGVCAWLCITGHTSALKKIARKKAL